MATGESELPPDKLDIAHIFYGNLSYSNSEAFLPVMMGFWRVAGNIQQGVTLQSAALPCAAAAVISLHSTSSAGYFCKE